MHGDYRSLQKLLIKDFKHASTIFESSCTSKQSACEIKFVCNLLVECQAIPMSKIKPATGEKFDNFSHET